LKRRITVVFIGMVFVCRFSRYGKQTAGVYVLVRYAGGLLVQVTMELRNLFLLSLCSFFVLHSSASKARDPELLSNDLLTTVSVFVSTSDSSIKPDCVISRSLDFRNEYDTKDSYLRSWGACSHVVVNGSIILDQTAELDSLGFLGNVRKVTVNIDIRDTPNLENLDGLEAISEVGGFVLLLDNKALTSLGTGLRNLRSIDGDLRIMGNKRLVHLSGLNRLSSISGHLYVENNEQLETFGSGFTNLIFVGSDLRIRNNQALTDISSLSKLLQVTGLILVQGNSPELACNFLGSAIAGSYDLRCASGASTRDPMSKRRDGQL
jgi:hypothetical protein